MKILQNAARYISNHGQKTSAYIVHMGELWSVFFIILEKKD